MTAEIPTDLAPFVKRLVAERRFLTTDDVLAESLRLLQASETLREEIRAGFDELDAGLGVPAADVYRKAEGSIREIARQRGG